MTLKPCEQNEHGFHNFMVVEEREYEVSEGTAWMIVRGSSARAKTMKLATKIQCRHCLLTSEEVREG